MSTVASCRSKIHSAFFSTHSCLSTFQALRNESSLFDYSNLTLNSSCPSQSAQDLNTTQTIMGCCFNLIFNTTAYQWRLAEDVTENATATTELLITTQYWEHCNLTAPGQCLCEYASISPASRSQQISWTLLITIVIILIYQHILL